MKKKEILSHINQKLPFLYNFSYCLVPDELQAQQIIIDAFTILSVERQEKFKKLKSSDLGEGKIKELAFDLCRGIFDLAKKRELQLQGQFEFTSFPEGCETFYGHLNIYTRAILFLKYTENWKVNEVLLALGLGYNDYISHVTMARNIVADKGYELKGADLNSIA